ncbi:hypothetical protein CLAFUW4_04614 [Fulvia fulva]|uniref:Uncharacterized protein n=1 Tax=Passalora fulva TaxID=5499 RepID=A0A9Q8LFM2_PASFU|nr:uncharacterized protein CLAFUR5_04574 [Fulvia fulva]KAK4626186.1 hypothetical protein CLAFUR4_04600 [Fulvia fulva]KAK4628464.1 hypothetical protein CLAFUR0_04602 [Fulvia fulva]UJO16512.1 hypothetical protein CLAFUR5_04574 [Fulvia fulva]WPV14015.1 hypothetical protein CLAFUW4_04614 [Fulvia fulva]WPV28328.1 hypothetical protein CLAFUW7_04606 [Fulvia fulva]
MAQHRIKYAGINDEAEGTYGAGWAQPLDWKRCSGLHNYLVETSGRNMTSQQTTWWDAYGDEISLDQPVAKTLHPNVLKLLMSAYAHRDEVEAPFFWNITSIPSPHEMFFNGLNEAFRQLDKPEQQWFDSGYDELDEGEPLTDGESEPMSDEEETPEDAEDELDAGPLDLENHRFITLYTNVAVLSEEKPVGLVYDQKAQSAAFIVAKSDIPAAFGRFSKKWMPLECYIDAWHGLVDRGKIVGTDGGKWKMHAAYGTWSSPQQRDDGIVALVRVL